VSPAKHTSDGTAHVARQAMRGDQARSLLVQAGGASRPGQGRGWPVGGGWGRHEFSSNQGSGDISGI